MRLEIGKTYLNRARTRTYKITGVGRGGMDTDIVTDGTQHWWLDGRKSDFLDNDNDLVEEVPAQGAQPILHADLIQAVLDGEALQWKQPGGQWAEPERNHAIFLLAGPMNDKVWRVKPDNVVAWAPVCKADFDDKHFIGNTCTRREFVPKRVCGGPVVKVLCIELDPDTLEVVSAKTEAP